MVKRDKNAHQSNHYKATHNSGGKSNKKSGGKGKKGNKSINQFLQIGKPGPHLLKHRQQQQAKKEKRANNRNNSKPKKEPQEHYSQQQQLFSLPSYQQAFSPPQTLQTPTQLTEMTKNKNIKKIKIKNNSGPYFPVNGVFEPVPGVTKQMRYPGHRNVNQSPYNLRATSYEKHAGEPGKLWVSDEEHEPIHGRRQHRPPHQSEHTNNNANPQDNYEQDIQYKYEDRDVLSAPAPGPSNTPKKERKPKWTRAEKMEKKEAQRIKEEEEETESQRVLTPQEEAEKKKKKKAKKQKAKENKKAAKEERKQQRKDANMAKGRKTGPGLNPYVDPEKKTQMRESFIDQLMADLEEKARLQAAGASSSIKHEDQDLPKPSYQTTEGGDAMKNGADFIQFVDSEAEEENTPVPTNQNINVQDTTNNIPETTAGHKRKRDGYGSDTEGSTGPPPGCPWMGHRQYSKLDSVPRMLTQELKDFVGFISPSREEHKIRQYVHRRIQRSIERLWPDAQVVVFGSFETRLYLPSSDMDIVVLRKREFVTSDLYTLSSTLRREGVAKEVVVISKARVPLVKFKETISDLPVDISFNITNGIDGARTAKQYMDEVPALRSLTLLVKHFLMTKAMNEVFHGGIGSLTTMIMIMSFLQMHPKIQQGLINPEDNLGVLLIEFFELYGHCFNYANVGLSVTDGGEYFDKIQNPVGQAFKGGRPGELLLCSVDPNDENNDTARGSYQLQQIRKAFVRAYGSLTRSVQQRRAELFGEGGSKDKPTGHIRFDDKNRVPADSVSKSSGLHRQNEVSLIKDILPIPMEILEHRRHIEDVFYRGQYQAMFGEPTGINGLDAMEGY
ncbi:hypothetical protein BGZ81_004064 [Podila clonocystis]|nr:hypothetical protein BGZ81_004064 [Podila clonocystis]